MKEWENAMRLYCLAGDCEGMEDRLTETPSAEEFFERLEQYMGKAPSDWTGLADVKYSYHNTTGYGFLAWGNLYIAIPEFDTYEKHTGTWACRATLEEAVEQCQHNVWKEEDEAQETRNDIDNSRQ